MISRTFQLVWFRGEKMGPSTVIMADPHLKEGWCNPVMIIRWVVAGVLSSRPERPWGENTLIPDVCGDHGVWTATDASGRKYEVRDKEWHDEKEKRKADHRSQTIPDFL